jgi:Spy/CpxP family protein refolding chaperone
MKRFLFLITCFVTFITIAQAQSPAGATAGQRQGGARGPAATEQTQPPNLGLLLQEANGKREGRVVQLMANVSTAWWTNTALVTKLGLTEVQKSKIENTFEAHRQNLTSSKDQLEKEEAQLAKLLEAESIERGSVFSQINRVIQARGEMERANATMTLEMREQLTRAQWTQLQASGPQLRILTYTNNTGPDLPVLLRAIEATPAAPGTRGPARGQQ